MSKDSSSKRGQCHGIVNKGHGGVKKGDRCRMYDNNHERYELCQNKNKDMCYMHCDCIYCSTRFAPTKNRGKRFVKSSGENKSPSFKDVCRTHYAHRPDFLVEEKDIEKLREVCIAVYKKYHHLWNDIMAEVKKNTKNKATLLKINSLQLQIDELRKEIE